MQCLSSIVCIVFTACDSGNEENIDPIYAVDLGLSVKWAWCNMGADCPEEEGWYFAWGETCVKSSYTYSNYKHYNHQTGEDIDIGTNISGTSYDVAHTTLGNGWRMPTREELVELITMCVWEKTNLNGTDGMFVTGPNGYRIFLPNVRGGAYWSGTFSSNELGFYDSLERNYNISYVLKWAHSLPWLSGGSANVRLGESACFNGLVIRPVMD